MRRKQRWQGWRARLKRWWRSTNSFDPLTSQPRSTRRPGGFNEQADARLDPNARFPGDQMGGGYGGAGG